MNTAYKYDIIDTYHNDYEDDTYQEDEVLKSLNSISLGDIMGEDHDIWLQKDSRFGFNIEIDDENAQPILREEGIHPYAIESLANFCKRFLGAYAHYNQQGAA